MRAGKCSGRFRPEHQHGSPQAAGHDVRHQGLRVLQRWRPWSTDSRSPVGCAAVQIEASTGLARDGLPPRFVNCACHMRWRGRATWCKLDECAHAHAPDAGSVRTRTAVHDHTMCTIHGPGKVEAALIVSLLKRPTSSDPHARTPFNSHASDPFPWLQHLLNQMLKTTELNVQTD